MIRVRAMEHDIDRESHARFLDRAGSPQFLFEDGAVRHGVSGGGVGVLQAKLHMVEPGGGERGETRLTLRNTTGDEVGVEANGTCLSNQDFEITPHKRLTA